MGGGDREKAEKAKCHCINSHKVQWKLSSGPHISSCLSKDTHVTLISSTLEKEMHQTIVNTVEGTVLTYNINFSVVNYLK